MSAAQFWSRCADSLQLELPEQQFNTWIRPLQPEEVEGGLCLFAPNKFVLDWVRQKFFDRIKTLMGEEAGSAGFDIKLELVSNRRNEVSWDLDSQISDSVDAAPLTTSID